MHPMAGAFGVGVGGSGGWGVWGGPVLGGQEMEKYKVRLGVLKDPGVVVTTV